MGTSKQLKNIRTRHSTGSDWSRAIFCRIGWSSPRLRHSAFRNIAKNACRTDAAISCAEHVTWTRRYTMIRDDKTLIFIALGTIAHVGANWAKGLIGQIGARKSPLTHWRCGLLYWLRGPATNFIYSLQFKDLGQTIHAFGLKLLAGLPRRTGRRQSNSFTASTKVDRLSSSLTQAMLCEFLLRFLHWTII